MSKQFCIRISDPAHLKLYSVLAHGQSETDWIVALIYRELSVPEEAQHDQKHDVIEVRRDMEKDEKIMVKNWNAGVSLEKIAEKLNALDLKPTRAKCWTKANVWWELDRLRKGGKRRPAQPPPPRKAKTPEKLTLPPDPNKPKAKVKKKREPATRSKSR